MYGLHNKSTGWLKKCANVPLFEEAENWNQMPGFKNSTFPETNFSHMMQLVEF